MLLFREICYDMRQYTNNIAVNGWALYLVLKKTTCRARIIILPQKQFQKKQRRRVLFLFTATIAGNKTSSYFVKCFPFIKMLTGEIIKTCREHSGVNRTFISYGVLSKVCLTYPKHVYTYLMPSSFSCIFYFNFTNLLLSKFSQNHIPFRSRTSFHFINSLLFSKFMIVPCRLTRIKGTDMDWTL